MKPSVQNKSKIIAVSNDNSVQSVVREITDVLDVSNPDLINNTSEISVKSMSDIYPWILLQKIELTSASPSLVDICNRKPGMLPVSKKQSPGHQLVNRVACINELRSSYNKLQKKVSTFVANQHPGGKSKTAFSSFVTPVFSKVTKAFVNSIYDL